MTDADARDESVDAPTTLPLTAADTAPDRPWPVRHLSPKIGEYIAKMSPVWVEGQVLNVKRWKHMVFLTLRDTDENVSLKATLPASEVDALGLELTPSSQVKAPRLSLAKVALECSHHSTVEVGDNRIVLGLVRHLFVEDGIIDPDTMRMNQKSFVAVGRMQGPGIYCTTEQILDLGPMPTPAQALAAAGARS